MRAVDGTPASFERSGIFEYWFFSLLQAIFLERTAFVF